MEQPSTQMQQSNEGNGRIKIINIFYNVWNVFNAHAFIKIVALDSYMDTKNLVSHNIWIEFKALNAHISVMETCNR